MLNNITYVRCLCGAQIRLRSVASMFFGSPSSDYAPFLFLFSGPMSELWKEKNRKVLGRSEEINIFWGCLNTFKMIRKLCWGPQNWKASELPGTKSSCFFRSVWSGHTQSEHASFFLLLLLADRLTLENWAPKSTTSSQWKQGVESSKVFAFGLILSMLSIGIWPTDFGSKRNRLYPPCAPRTSRSLRRSWWLRHVKSPQFTHVLPGTCTNVPSWFWSAKNLELNWPSLVAFVAVSIPIFIFISPWKSPWQLMKIIDENLGYRLPPTFWVNVFGVSSTWTCNMSTGAGKKRTAEVQHWTTRTRASKLDGACHRSPQEVETYSNDRGVIHFDAVLKHVQALETWAQNFLHSLASRIWQCWAAGALGQDRAPPLPIFLFIFLPVGQGPCQTAGSWQSMRFKVWV